MAGARRSARRWKELGAQFGERCWRRGWNRWRSSWANRLHSRKSPADEEHQPFTDAQTANKADIAKESQNPIGNLTIMPFENYTNFGFGPHNGTQNILEFEPVVPFHLSADWNLITPAIIPFVWNPSLYPAESVPQAIAPTDASAFFSPRNTPNGWTWGVGPVAQIPTETNVIVG